MLETFISGLVRFTLKYRFGFAEVPGIGFALDSPLEEAGFELLVPPSKRTAVPELAPSFFAPDCTPAAIVLVSENDDFELPASHSNLARRAT
jgi:hypothetical protein